MPPRRTRRRPLTDYFPHEPHPRQREFLGLDDCPEVLFGGAAGGGKTDAILMAAAQYVHVPGYAALLLRRSYADLSLPDAIMERSHEYWTGLAEWSRERKRWRFPSGATVTFSYLQYEADKYRYQGAQLQFIAFDELTQFSESQYTYLFSRLRKKAGVEVPLRMRSTSNPGGVGHEWVKKRFIAPHDDPTRRFVPSRLEDNPGIDRASYVASLNKLNPIDSARLRGGDWDVAEKGRYFEPDWFQFIPAAPAGLRWVRYWDLAATEQRSGSDPDWTAGAKVAVQRFGADAWKVFIGDVRRVRATPAGVEAFIRATAQEDGRGVPIVLEEEPGASGKSNSDNYRRRVLFGWSVAGHRKTGSKETMWLPLSSQAQGGNLWLVEGPWNAWWTREACAAPNPGVHDDGLDAAAGGFAVLVDDGGAARSALLAMS